MKAIVKVSNEPSTLSENKLKLGMIVKVVTGSVNMNGVIVMGHETRDLYFCPITIVKLKPGCSGDIALDLWPIENIYLNGGVVTLFDGTITISN